MRPILLFISMLLLAVSCAPVYGQERISTQGNVNTITIYKECLVGDSGLKAPSTKKVFNKVDSCGLLEVDPGGNLNFHNGNSWQAVTPGGGTVTSITATSPLTGGTITTSGSIGLGTVGTAGTYGSGGFVPVITTDVYGRVTAVSVATVTPVDANVQFSDNTVGNVSTSEHGYAPKGPGTGLGYLNDLGSYSVPVGSGGTVTAVSVASTNGFGGSSSGGATPALTLSVTVTPGSILKSTTGGAIAAAVPGTDYGTVSQVSSGSFSPLFNVSVATPTTTPTFTFAGISQSAHLFYGNNGSSGVPSFNAVQDVDLSLSNNTTNNATTGQHGFLPLLSGNSTQFLNGNGSWATPAGSALTLQNVTDNGNTTTDSAVFRNLEVKGDVNFLNGYLNLDSQGSAPSPELHKMKLFMGSGGNFGIRGTLGNSQYFDIRGLTSGVSLKMPNYNWTGDSISITTHTVLSKYVESNGTTITSSATIPYTDLTGTPSGLPPTGAAGGDLAGTYPNPAVAGTVVKSVVETFPGVLFSPTVTFTTASNIATGTVVLVNQSPNSFLAGSPTATATPTFRGIVSSDLPANAVFTGSVTATIPAYATQQTIVANFTGTCTPTSSIASTDSRVSIDDTAQTGALQFNPPTGSWAFGQMLMVTVYTTTAQALTYASIFKSSSVTLPTTTTSGKATQLQFRYMYLKEYGINVYVLEALNTM